MAPTSKDSPTAGEIAQNDVPSGQTEPVDQPDEVIADTEGQEVTFDEDPETNFPAAPEPEEAPEELENPNADPEAQEGEVWAIYTGQQPSQRILQVADLRELGDKESTEPLVWDRNNRYRREISGEHQFVRDYIENLDGNFRIVRPE